MQSWLRNWSDVRVFLAVARCGSTLAASRRLGIAQPTVARRIDALEHSLKLRLFDRDTRGFRLNAHGTALLAAAEEVETAILAFERDAEKRGRSEAEVIRVTAAGPFIEELVSEVFAEFAEAHPGTRFTYFASGDLVDMEAGDADIAIRAAERPAGDAALCRRLPDFSYGVFCTQAYADRCGMPAGPDELGDHDFVGYTGPVAKSRAYRWLAERVSEDRIVTHCNNQQSACRVLRTGTAIGMVTHLVARREPGLIRCFASPPELTNALWMLVSPAARERPVIGKLIAFSFDRIAARVRQNDAWP